PLPTTLESNFDGNRDGTTTAPSSPPSTGPWLGAEPTARMSLQEIVQRAVVNSLDVKVAGYRPAIDQTRVIEAQARFDPTLFSNMQFEQQNQDVAIPVAGATNGKNLQQILTGQAGIRQALESGGSIEFRADLSRTFV